MRPKVVHIEISNVVTRLVSPAKRVLYAVHPHILNQDIPYMELENVIFDGEDVVFDGEQVVA